jgi:ABC-type branched-subunit amino acid transport system permease subunit
MMQPFQFDQSALVQSTPKPVRGLPARVKTVLMLKTLGCLFTIGGSLIMMTVVSDPQSWPEGFGAEWARRVAMLSVVATGLSLVELLGVAGTWSFKRWGVYVLSGFSMLNFVVRMQAHQTFSAGLSLISTLIVGIVIASRWEDFE